MGRESYYQTWHRYLRKPVEPLTRDEAKARDETGEGYVVVVGESDHPEGFIEIRDGFYGVSFLDHKQREYLMYTFEELQAGKLFLKEAIFREYEGGSDKPARASAYRFSPDGTVAIETGSLPFRQVTVSDGKVDVSRNWESTPRFGDYGRLVEKERLIVPVLRK